MSKVTGALSSTRVSQKSAARLDCYRPQFIAPAMWAVVRPFVADAACDLCVDASASDLRTVRVLARLAAWALGEGLPLDRELVLDPDTVERFVAEGLTDDRSRATYRSVLRRIGPLLTSQAPWEPRPTTVGRRQVATPYTQVELGRLRLAAADQATPGRVRAARAILALGAGAGLDGRWVAQVTAADVSSDGDVVLVRVGEPAARTVPVLAGWQEEVLDLAANAGGEVLVGGTSRAKNRAGSLAASLVVGHGTPRFSAARLRSTWLVTHLAAGNRLPELVAAAGLRGLTVLSDLLPNVERLGEFDARRLLSGR